MADRKKDEMAAALDAMMAGGAPADDDVVSEHHDSDTDQAADASAVSADRPATPAQPAAEPPQPATQRPDRPAAARPAAPSRPAATARPASPERAAAPSTATSRRPATPDVRSPARPAARQPAGPEPIFARLSFRQTIIPPLLTGGLLMIILGVLRFVAPSDSPFAFIPLWVSIMVLVLGALLIAVGALNMYQVRRQLSEQTA